MSPSQLNFSYGLHKIFRFLNDFFLVGILEQFDDTLKLFEKLIPKFFKGAPHALVSEQVQGTTNLTKTKDKIRMSPESRQYLASGPLKYEVRLWLQCETQKIESQMKKASISFSFMSNLQWFTL